MADSYITVKAEENKQGRVAVHATTNVMIPFIVTAIYMGREPRDIKCISSEHADAVYALCKGWLYKVPLKNGMVIELGRA